MTIVMPDRDHDLLEVVQSIHDDLELPEGYRAEIIGGQIAVAATPFGKHARIIARIRRAAWDLLPPEHDLYQNVSLEEPNRDRYIPDLALMPDDLLETQTVWLFPGSACLLAVEVTSPHQAGRDYTKAAGYARAETPVYLIVDQSRCKCIVYSEPERGSYQTVVEASFGKKIVLPLSKPITIDTSRF